MDLSSFTDEELAAIAGSAPASPPPTDLRTFAEQEAAAAGLPAGLVSRVIRQESGGRVDAVSPKGARGPMQLMPATAQELGVNINDPHDNIRGGVRYLKQQMDEFGSPELALAAYNAGPGAVRKYGGIPPYAETQNYVSSIQGDASGDPAMPQADLSGFTDEELAAIAGEPIAKAPAPKTPANMPRTVSRSGNGGVTVEALGPAPENPTIAQDVWSGFKQPFANLADRVKAGVAAQTAQAQQPLPNPLEAAKQFGAGLLDTAGLAGDVLGLTSAPVQAIVRPVARGVNRATAGLPMYAPPKFSDIGSGRMPQVLNDQARQATLEGAINTALSAARPATPTPALAAPSAKPMNVDQLRAAKSAAYDAVDQLGVAYKPAATARLADEIGYDLATKRINPKVTPKAHAVMEDIQDQLRSGNPVSLTQLDDMRQQVWRATGKENDAEQFMGVQIRDMIDSFVDGATPAQVVNGNAPEAAQALATARDLNTRYRKVQEVTNRTESADLRAASTYAGGNKANAARQNLRPLIDPKSPQRIKNLTPDEVKALNRAVRGTGGANLARQVGKVLDPRGLLGSISLGPLGIPTAGVTPVIGALSSEASNALTMKSINDLLKLMASGGIKAKALPPVSPTLALGGRPAIPLLSGPGLVGASEVAAPLTRIPSASQGSQGGRTAQPMPRKKRK